MVQKGTAVILLTASHRFQGEIHTGGQRLQDILNNSLTVLSPILPSPLDGYFV